MEMEDLGLSAQNRLLSLLCLYNASVYNCSITKFEYFLLDKYEVYQRSANI